MQGRDHNEVELEANGIEVSCVTGIHQRRIKTISIRVKAAKELFSVADMLNQYGAYPSFAEVVEEKVRECLKEYLIDAKQVVNQAVDLSRTTVKSPRRG